MLASQSLALGCGEVMVAGGMESTSNIPYYISTGREGFGFGNHLIEDALVKDCLWDVFNQVCVHVCMWCTCSAPFSTNTSYPHVAMCIIIIFWQKNN